VVQTPAGPVVIIDRKSFEKGELLDDLDPRLKGVKLEEANPDHIVVDDQGQKIKIPVPERQP